MSPADRQALESQAERALRRGELSRALRLFLEVAEAFPDDTALAARVVELETHLGPLEPLDLRTPVPSSSGVFQSPAHEAEAMAARGDFAGAIATYRKLLTDQPHLELVKERLTELFQLAQARGAPRSTASREQILEGLLGRIGARRRS